ncbi:uncharacterized protein LOC117335456 [Pecten maximus]|uniref:uncharacterized protein LOC117335456 n=1 Tax=Pecten maximus TaxID=6579 RepID=UPI0014590673|nr:uncharacterized protein LOC117335456 [Pecten maximus]
MRSVSLSVLLLLFGVVCCVEGRGYLSKRPRPQIDLPEKGVSKATQMAKPEKTSINRPASSRSSRCPRPRCTFGRIPDACRQETFFTTKAGRRCKGCDIDICPDGNFDTGSTSFTDQISAGSDLFRDSVSRSRQAERRQPPRRVQDDFRNNELFDNQSTRRGSRRQSSGQSTFLRSNRNRIPVTDNSWASPGF